MQSHFTSELFEFLAELGANNNRGVVRRQQGPLRTARQGAAGGVRRGTSSRTFTRSASTSWPTLGPTAARCSRIYRDVRFSKDKTPYKTQAAVQFRHEAAKSVHAPGFYLHLAPSEIFAGVGIWRPDSATAGRIRDRIVEDPDGWRSAVGDPDFAEEFDLSGESLKRPPKGFDPRAPPHRGPQAQGPHRHLLLRRRRGHRRRVHRLLRRRLPGLVALHGVPHHRRRPPLLTAGPGGNTGRFVRPIRLTRSLRT